ncbi:hypothetical protein Salat_0461100 [Sesamum alatum]|uniref:Uncharacterized protein n=1 Tax=Sesamum alatum TaxID=300844 RepID=A0AAE1Z3M7_9LAMI|nr:hypothetical protein Salat_0461100 [Sesamum alatum]
MESGLADAARRNHRLSRLPPHNLQDDEEEAEIIFVGREKKGFRGIGLNALPQHDYRAAKKGVNDQERGRGTAPAAVASSSGDEKAIFFHSECGWNFTVEEVLEEQEEEKERRQNRRWKALLDVAEDALREYDENLGKKDRNLNRTGERVGNPETAGSCRKGGLRRLLWANVGSSGKCAVMILRWPWRWWRRLLGGRRGRPPCGAE